MPGNSTLGVAAAAAGLPVAVKKAAAVDESLLSQVNKLLTHIVRGYQGEAEEMLKANPELALCAGATTDHAGRQYCGLTALQLAVGLLDYHMWVMVCKYMPRESIVEQLQYLMEPAGQQLMEGSRQLVQEIIDALGVCINNYAKWSIQEYENHWINVVGVKQKQGLMHILQEYDMPTQAFCRNSDESETLTEEQVMAESEFQRTDIFAGKNFDFSNLGKSFGLCRTNGLPSRAAAPPWVPLGRAVDPEIEFLTTILGCRIKQLEMLLREYPAPTPDAAGKAPSPKPKIG
jgi:hypothetical protein